MAAVHTAVYLIFFRGKENLARNPVSFVTSLVLAVISLVVNLYWNLVFLAVTSIQSEVTLIFVYAMNIVISTLLLVCQFGIQRGNDMKLRLAMSELLQSQAQEQYRVSKENYDAISIKCHDLKHRLMEIRTSGQDADFDDIIQAINSYGAEIRTGSDVLDVIFQP